eukprot:gnl/MRDRNA2_/MRDRNA2_99893_c0_seq1.p1 gnl/MRDRNA2_/MRDRNA2_99893_c0~~gnl/MRDRNA2_/MRDRNA2_99893_c0_seq1.p1  ORF type:complete len:353 (-),score=59.19 gnl/MRDRNA2_/MRDRNA2_99893_c0_seq1:261-1319(-)
MLQSFLRLSGSETRASGSAGYTTGNAAATGKPVTLMVIQADDYDWNEIFKGASLRDGRPIRVVQTGWTNFQVHADTYSKSGICVEVRSVDPDRSIKTGCAVRSLGEKVTTVHPDFLLVRNQVRTPDFDGRNLLNGFMFADVPSLNSLESILLNCERPAMQGFLHRLNKRLGDEVFPVVPQHFASSSRVLFYGYTFPAVVKVGSAHAGAGKMLIKDHHQMSDFRSVLQMMPGEHCLVEPFIRGESDLRIQKIGTHYRAFRRVGISGEWKTNTGTSMMENIEVEERYRRWADEASAMFGGLEILAVDAIVEEGTGKEYIVEVNDTAIGLHPDFAAEDNLHIKDLVLEQMNNKLC